MTARILVDSNVLLDVIKSDPVWGAWSADALATDYEYAAHARRPALSVALPGFRDEIGGHIMASNVQ